MIHLPLEKHCHFRWAGRGRTPSGWVRAFLGTQFLCWASAEQALPVLDLLEARGNRGVRPNGIWSKSVWRPQTSQPMKIFLSLPFCVHWGRLLWVGDYWSLKLKGQTSALSHPSPPLFLSLPPSQQTFCWWPMRGQAGNVSVGKKIVSFSWRFCSTVWGGHRREV